MQTTPPPAAKFGQVQGLWKAPMFDKDFLRDVMFRWTGAGLIYLHLIVGLIWIPLTIQAEVKLIRFVDEAPTWVDGFPSITVDQGTVYTAIPPERMPYSWTPGGQDEPVLVLDTTGQTQSLEGRSEPLLITKTHLVTEDGPVSLDAVPFFWVDQALILEMMDGATLWFPVMYYLCAFLVSITYRCGQAMLYGLIAFAMARFDDKVLGLGGGMRLAAMAITCVLYLDMVVSMLPWDIPGWGLVAFALAMAYLWWGVKVAKEGPPPDVAAWRAGDAPEEAPAPS